MTFPLVSIVIPIYNAERYIGQCLESILSQSYRNIEVILINDGSEDSSGTICEHYATRDSRIKIFEQANQGPSVARNKGIRHSKGKFLQFVDADDEISIDMVEKMVMAYDSEVDLVICGYNSTVNEGNKIIESRIIPSIQGIYSINQLMYHFPELFDRRLIHSPCNKLYNRNLIVEERIEFPKKVNHGEDLLFNINYLRKCQNISLIQKPFYQYIKVNNPQSLTKIYKLNYLQNRKDIFKQISSFLMAYPEVPENIKLLQKIYTSYVLRCLENIFHKDLHLTRSMKRKEIQKILTDRWVQDNIQDFIAKSYRHKLIKFFIKQKSIYGITLLFYLRDFVK